MTERIASQKRYFITEKQHHRYRKPETDPYLLAKEFAAQGLSDLDRASKRLQSVLEQEEPVIFADERIAFVRTVTTIPELHTEEEIKALESRYRIHEKGDLCNINVDYTKLLSCGFDRKREELKEYIQKFQGDAEKVRYLQVQIDLLDSVQALADRYREKALAEGNTLVAETLAQVPAGEPQTFLQALQMLRILHYVMWCGRNYHNTLGRFDQYMYPYFQRDMEKGLLDEQSALELVEEFFLTFNRDSDLYPGMQQGDNGQSMVLGGLNPDGSDSYNLLSRLCLQASLELKLIDPKINLRVHSKTPLETYVLGSELTKQGLGFPQYSNDEVVIPGLLELGYDKEDAYNYVVAACWEFIIPGKGIDIPNIDALSFTKAVSEVISQKLAASDSFEEFRQAVRQRIQAQVDEMCANTANVYIFPAPFVSLMIDGCAEQARDASLGAKYNNYGFHGTGIATAADSLAAIDQLVFREKQYLAGELVDALQDDFVNSELLLNQLRFASPKVGNDQEEPDALMSSLLDDFADALQGKQNDRGGIFRAGTGSAMYYLWHVKDIPATPDGRCKGEAIAANYSPSLFARCKGPVSIIRSFTKPNLKRVINGGPLTLELHDSAFRNPEAVEKVALLVKSFVDLGGHQLQLNAVNRDTLLDAQKHPENYQNLIVRVWGWSGYFVNLDREYQDHIIQRMELSVL